MNSNGKIKIVLFIVFICLLIFGIIFVVADRSDFDSDDINNTKNPEPEPNTDGDKDEDDILEEEVEIDNQLYDIFIPLNDFNINASLTTLLNIFVNYNTSNYSEGINNMIDSDYINNNPLTGKTYDSVNLTNAILYDNRKIVTYVVEGNLFVNTYFVSELVDTIIFIVQVDYETDASSIIPTNYTSIEEVKNDNIVFNEDTINQNKDNDFYVYEMSESTIVNQLFNNLNFYILNYPEGAYNKMDLTDEQTYFSNYDEFVDFIKSNEQKLNAEQVVSAKKNGYQTIESFEITGHSYTYTFNMSSIYDYKVIIE